MNGFISILAANPVEHVIDKPLMTWGHDLPSFLSSDGSIWWISNVTVMLVVGAIVTALLVVPAARRIATGKTRSLDDYRTQGTLANLVESVCLYLRDDVFKSVLEDQTDRFTPILWTFFWYILVCNLLGLIPLADITGTFLGITGTFLGWGHHGHGIGGTATQSIWVTGALAITAFLFYNFTAFIKSPLGYLKHLTAGAPIFMWPIMVPVEILGTFIKPFALAIRLFANMTGGHLVIAVFLSFVPVMIKSMGPAGYGMAVVPMLGAIAINMLEILVAFIQAYIFTFLTCLFLGQLVVHEHEEHHHEQVEHVMPHGMATDPDQVVDAEAVHLGASHAAGRH
jgi:F-type H+-transporting ATPase subunit a